MAAAVAAPASAQEPLRYTISPAEKGFVRLDTQTGAVTHCAPAYGAWRCDPPLYAESEIDARLRALDTKIEGLGAELAALAGRVAELAAPPPAPPAPEVVAELPVEPGPPVESPPAAAPNFFERAIDRLFRLVSGVKAEIARN